jgi:hypothetical protein
VRAEGPQSALLRRFRQLVEAHSAADGGWPIMRLRWAPRRTACTTAPHGRWGAPRLS